MGDKISNNVFADRVVKDIRDQTGVDINNDIHKITELPDDISYKIVSILLSWACQPQGYTYISIERQYLCSFPKEWCVQTIITVAKDSIDFNDYWDFRRFLELGEIIDAKLIQYGLSLGVSSTDPDIIEAVQDYIHYI